MPEHQLTPEELAHRQAFFEASSYGCRGANLAKAVKYILEERKADRQPDENYLRELANQSPKPTRWDIAKGAELAERAHRGPRPPIAPQQPPAGCRGGDALRSARPHQSVGARRATSSSSQRGSPARSATGDELARLRAAAPGGGMTHVSEVPLLRWLVGDFGDPPERCDEPSDERVAELILLLRATA